MTEQPEDNDFEGVFRQSYLREFGFDLLDRAILIDDLRVRAVAKSPQLKKFPIESRNVLPRIDATTRCYFAEGWLETPIYRLGSLQAGQSLAGPAILMQETSTILIEPGCQAEITKYGDVSIKVSAKDGKADRDLRYGGAQVGPPRKNQTLDKQHSSRSHSTVYFQ